MEVLEEVAADCAESTRPSTLPAVMDKDWLGDGQSHVYVRAYTYTTGAVVVHARVDVHPASDACNRAGPRAR